MTLPAQRMGRLFRSVDAGHVFVYFASSQQREGGLCQGDNMEDAFDRVRVHLESSARDAAERRFLGRGIWIGTVLALTLLLLGGALAYELRAYFGPMLLGGYLTFNLLVVFSVMGAAWNSRGYAAWRLSG
jgi:hypothetical protein